MVDIHSHILPEIDDGSKSVSESVSLLHESYSQGVTHIVATPHFYAEDGSPKEFLKRRDASFEKLKPYLDGDMPKILFGAEVKYFEGISRNPDVELLKTEGTDLILVEMPFMNWSDRIVSEVCELHSGQHTRVIIAHIERYFGFGAKKYLPELLRSGMLIQSNADSFIGSRFRTHRLMNMLYSGEIQLLGSDCHNMTSRPPRLGEASKAIVKRLGKKALDKAETLAYDILGLNAPLGDSGNG